ncbi:tRNA (guanosine(37)-N1)-methyltransferase TrmD [Clostridia bacterium OttesenSCG-928-O13]|nr:tRNA (guanosine(37)-N1)-methyltransferase TrmD [Clostridia bacterium OttesenSCG-928-O13]
MIRIDIATLFPDMCEAVMNESIMGRARREGKYRLFCHQIRDYTLNKQRQVDDYPYGGGHGMIMQADPIARCLDAILAQYEAEGLPRPHICFLTPVGAPYVQQKAKELATLSGLVLVCGHYEGMDQRVIDEYADEEISLGDFVLSGGEVAALAVADSVLRLQPGVLKSAEGYEGDSFYSGLLEHPQYSRPEVWRGRAVPSVLLSGHAANIAAWRAGQSVRKTRTLRPDLYAKLPQEVASPAAKFPKKRRKKSKTES